MHKTLTKVKNKRLADLIENIIKKMNKSKILECVQFESSQLATQFKNPDLIQALNDDMLDFLVGHEVLHCVFDHMQARGDRKPMLYNAAADYNINMTLVEQNIGKPITEEGLFKFKLKNYNIPPSTDNIKLSTIRDRLLGRSRSLVIPPIYGVYKEYIRSIYVII